MKAAHLTLVLVLGSSSAFASQYKMPSFSERLDTAKHACRNDKQALDLLKTVKNERDMDRISERAEQQYKLKVSLPSERANICFLLGISSLEDVFSESETRGLVLIMSPHTQAVFAATVEKNQKALHAQAAKDPVTYARFIDGVVAQFKIAETNGKQMLAHPIRTLKAIQDDVNHRAARESTNMARTGIQ